MPADKRKMWLGDNVKFYEPIEELDGSFRGRLGKFQNLLSEILWSISLKIFWNFKRQNDQFQRTY